MSAGGEDKYALSLQILRLNTFSPVVIFSALTASNVLYYLLWLHFLYTPCPID